MPGAKDPTTALREAAGSLPHVVEAMSCNQASYKAGKKAFLYVGPGAKGVGYKAMFKLEASRGEAESLAKSEPERYELGAGNWVTTRFSAEKPLPKKIWSRWLKESYAGGDDGWKCRERWRSALLAMKRGISIALGVLIALGAATAAPAKGKNPIVQGGTLEFQLSDLSGSPVSSADPRFAGKVLLVELWATWCPPCITEIPTLVDLQSRYGDRGLVVVGIAFEAEELADQRRARLREFVEKHGINYLVLDGGQPDSFEAALPSVTNVRGFPVEILVDGDGGVVVARNGYGFKKKWAAKLGREIEALLSELAK